METKPSQDNDTHLDYINYWLDEADSIERAVANGCVATGSLERVRIIRESLETIRKAWNIYTERDARPFY